MNLFPIVFHYNEQCVAFYVHAYSNAISNDLAVYYECTIRIMMQERLHICETIFFTMTLKKHCDITAKNLLITNVYVMTDKVYYFDAISKHYLQQIAHSL